jgi:dipeptidyl aminopeptidase/acylaminoacyl peptidase
MTIGSGEATRLSPDHSVDRLIDSWPSWSPDGSHIAFVRALPPDRDDRYEPPLIYVMSPAGADILKVCDFPLSDTFFPHSQDISWSPDSNFIVAGRHPTPPSGSDARHLSDPAAGRFAAAAHHRVSPRHRVFSNVLA